MEKLFNLYDTEGYSQNELDALNREWEEIVLEMGLEPYTEEYDIQSKKFCDDVSRR